MKYRILIIATLLLSLFVQHAEARYISRTLRYANDSTIVSNDTILSTNVAPANNDSVALVTDSLNSVASLDTLSVATLDTLSVVSDSLSVATDSLSVATDSLTVANDSLSSVADSIANPFLVDGIAPKREYKHFKVTPRSDKEYNNLVTYYKNQIKSGYVEELPKAYLAWKEAFNSRENRCLDLYFDGVAIIMACVINDTINGNYDNLKLRREEIEEIYDLAVENVDALNSQIDFSSGTDSITVAELRSQQITYYDHLWSMDSVFHSTHHNKNYSDDATRTHWANEHVHDSLEVYKQYPWYKDLVYSNSKNISVIHLLEFAEICHMKTVYDIRKHDLSETGKPLQKYVKEILEADKAKCEERIDKFIDAETDPQLFNNYNVYRDAITVAFTEALSAFIGDDLGKLEEYYKNMLAESGRTYENFEKIYKSRLKSNKESELYLEACRQVYQKNKTYDLALEIINCYKAQNKYGQTKKYYTDVFEFEEFKQLSDLEKANRYIDYGTTLKKAGRFTDAYKGYCLAKELLPEYPESYFAIGVLLYEYNNKLKDPFKDRFRFCVAVDFIEISLNKIRKLQENTELVTKLNEDILVKTINDCKKNFPSKEDVHMIGKGKEKELELFGTKFKSKLRSE